MDARQGIKVMLAAEGITQNALGERLGLTTGNISRLMTKDDFRMRGDLKKIADALNADVKITFEHRATGTRAECDV